MGKKLMTCDEHGSTYSLGNGMWRLDCSVTDTSSLWMEVTDEQLKLLCDEGAYGYYMPDGTPTVRVSTMTEKEKALF